MADNVYGNLSIANKVSGQTELLNILKNQLVTGLSDKINSTTEVMNAIRQAWSGVDTSAFVTEFENRRKNVVGLLDEKYALVEKQLNEIVEQWDQFRKTTNSNLFNSNAE